MGPGFPSAAGASSSSVSAAWMVASTVKAPQTRVILLSTSGRSTRVTNSGGSLLAMDFSVMRGTSPPTSSPLRFCLRS